MDGLEPLTRRALARTTAGALGVSLLGRIPAAIAAAGEPVWEEQLGALAPGRTVTRFSGAPFALIGISYRPSATPTTPTTPTTSAAAVVRVRALHADGTRSPWFDARPRHGGVAEPIWSGPAVGYELRASERLQDVTAHLVAPQPDRAARAAAAPPYQTPAAPTYDAGPGQPTIIPRSAWATRASAPKQPPAFGAVELAFVHHTDGANGYSPRDTPAIIQSICLFHERVNRWHDIGYNFVVDRYGHIYEARAGGIDEPVIGAQAGGYNTFSTGVAVLGTFVDVVPPPVAIRALEHLLAWKLALHGVPTTGTVRVSVTPDIVGYGAFRPGQHVTLERVSGHRDGDQTDCPGDALYSRLPSIRRRVKALAGPTYRLTLGVSPLAHPTPVATTPLTASGVLSLASGEPLADATIELQSRGKLGSTTISEASTGPDGGWQVPLTLAQTTVLRAVHLARPAVTSTAVTVGIAPAVTLAVLPGLHPGIYVATGTVAPARRKVVIDVYELLAPAGKKRIVHRQVRATSAGFVASVKLIDPGTYLVVARTLADEVYAPGASPPVQVAVPPAPA